MGLINWFNLMFPIVTERIGLFSCCTSNPKFGSKKNPDHDDKCQDQDLNAMRRI